MRAVSKVGVMPWRLASSMAAELASGVSRKTDCPVTRDTRPRKEKVGDLHVVSEQRPDLETSPARAENTVAGKTFLADDAQGLPLSLPDPAAQERGARCGEHGLVVAHDLIEGDDRKIDEARRDASSADPSMANIAVGKLEPGLAIGVLLGEDAV